jgi:putative nucleotidyltransferase with HDIG domain
MTGTPQAGGKWGALREKLHHLLLERIEGGKLVLPAMPATAQRVIECLESGQHQERVAGLLEADPVLALEVLRMANSASVGSRVRIDSISHALSMLGSTRVRALLVGASARQVFVSRSRAIREVTATLWAHSVAVASAARQIAVRAGLQEKEAPYLAGLMHDIGKPIAAIHLLELERSVSRSVQDRWIDPSEWLSIVQEVHRPVGIAVAKHWHLSPAVCKAIEDCVEFDPIDRLSTANTVRFANALAKREGVYAGTFDAEQVDTVLMIGRSMLGLQDDVVDALAQAVRSSKTEAVES